MTTMTVRIGGKVIDKIENGVSVFNRTYADALLPIEHSFESRIEKKIDSIFGKAFTFSAFVGALSSAKMALAASGAVGLAERMMPLIHMVQDFALPVGIVVSSWGLIEMIMGNIESGKHKLKWSIIGFIGMFLIPEVFYAIRDAFQKG